MVKLKFFPPDPNIKDRVSEYFDKMVRDGEKHILVLRRGVLGELVFSICDDEYFSSRYDKYSDEFEIAHHLPVRFKNEAHGEFKSRFVDVVLQMMSEMSARDDRLSQYRDLNMYNL